MNISEPPVFISHLDSWTVLWLKACATSYVCVCTCVTHTHTQSGIKQAETNAALALGSQNNKNVVYSSQIVSNSEWFTN